MVFLYRDNEYMTDYLEDGMTADEVKQAIVENGGKVTGSAIEQLKRGWAMMGFKGAKAHYYVESDVDLGLISKHGRHRLYESLCGVENECSDSAPAFEPGGFDRCQNCMRLEKKKMPVRLWRTKAT